MIFVVQLQDALLAEQEQISFLETIATQVRIIRQQLAQKQVLANKSAEHGAELAQTQHIPREQASEGSGAGHRAQNHDARQQRPAPIHINLTQSDGSETHSHISLSSDTQSESSVHMQDNEIQEPVSFNEEEDAIYMANEYLDDEIAKEVELMEQPYQSTQESVIDTQEETASSPTQSAFVRPFPSSKRVLHVRGGKTRISGNPKGRKVAINAWLRRTP
ncbi:hypothetical protein VKS41_006049 [Umbelopsis sp. WA50703]|jgi:hypothetical protein